MRDKMRKFDTLPEWADKINFQAHSPSGSNRPNCKEFFEKVIARPNKIFDRAGCAAQAGRVCETYAKEVYKRAKYYKIPYTEALDMRIKQFFDMFKRRRDKINAEDERETPGEYRVKYTEEELNDFFYKELRDKYIAFAKTKYPEAVGI